MFTWLYINIFFLSETSPNETSSLSSILGFLPFYYYFNDSVHFPIKFGIVLEFEQWVMRMNDIGQVLILLG